ncbi:hypothetical protein [Deinococcus sp.]|uniref:hypothetical protein n=1 Tax=Deinococcus sp. TaxID=47478 RepID=UPI003CC5DB1C
MKVGLIGSFGARPRAFWEAFLGGLGAEVARPALPAQDVYELGRQSLPNEAAHVQYLLGQVLASGQSDLLLTPDLLPVSQDAWGEALAELLPRRISGLPALQTVPQEAEAALSAAGELGQRLIHNPGVVRLALERARPLSQPPKGEMPPLSVASRATVAVLGPPVLLSDDYLSGPLRLQFAGLGLHPVYATDLPAAQIEERAERFGDAPAGQRWLNGAQGLLEGKSAVRGLLYVYPARDTAWERALSRMARAARKPDALLAIEPGQHDWDALERLARQVQGTPAGEA